MASLQMVSCLHTEIIGFIQGLCGEFMEAILGLYKDYVGVPTLHPLTLNPNFAILI